MSEKRLTQKTSSKNGRGRETKTTKARKSNVANRPAQKGALVKLFLSGPTEQPASDLLACFDDRKSMQAWIVDNALESIMDCAMMLKRFGAKAECVMQLASGLEGVSAYFSLHKNRFPLLASYVKSLGAGQN